MSRRGGSSGGPVSLFAFQDIITTVSGIMVLVVLLLALEVLSAKSLKTPTPKAPPKEQRAEKEIAALSETIRKLEERIVRVVKEREQVAKLKLDQAPEELERASRRARETTREMAAMRPTLEQRTRQTAQLERETTELDRKTKELEARLKEVKEKVRQDSSLKRVHYVFARKAAKTPILVECSGEGVQARVLDGKSRTVEFFDPRSVNYQSSLRKFAAWARKRNFLRELFVVVVKPSAAGYAPRVIQTLRRSGFEVGFEPLEEERTAIGEKKAAK